MLLVAMLLPAMAQQVEVTSLKRLLEDREEPAYYPVLNQTGTRLVYQTDDAGGFKASTRASADCDINLAEICSRFGGGGHAKAAGFQIKMEPEKAVRKVVSVIETELNKLG